MPPKKDTSKKGSARVGQPKGSRLAYDDTKQEAQKKKRGRPRKEVQPEKPVAQSTGKSAGGWMAHVKKVWTAGKKKNPDYSYKSAMSDAKKTYKK